MPYVKFRKKNFFVLPDFDVAFKVYLKSSNITRYFLTKIGHSYMCAIRRLKFKMFEYFWRISLKIREGRSHMSTKSSRSKMCAIRPFGIKLLPKIAPYSQKKSSHSHICINIIESRYCRKVTTAGRIEYIYSIVEPLATIPLSCLCDQIYTRNHLYRNTIYNGQLQLRFRYVI